MRFFCQYLMIESTRQRGVLLWQQKPSISVRRVGCVEGGLCCFCFARILAHKHHPYLACPSNSNIITAGVAIGELSGTGCAPDGVVSEGDSCYLSKTGYAPASVTCTNTLFQPSIAVFESLECTKLSLSNGEVGSALAGHTVAVVCNAGFTCSAEPCTVTCLDAGSGGGPSTYSVPPRCSRMHPGEGWG